MRSRVFAQLTGNLIAGLFALMFLQSCGLKGDLYLAGGEDDATTIREQENQEFLKESLDEQTEDVESGGEPSFEERTKDILDDSQEQPMPEEKNDELLNDSPEKLPEDINLDKQTSFKDEPTEILEER